MIFYYAIILKILKFIPFFTSFELTFLEELKNIFGLKLFFLLKIYLIVLLKYSVKIMNKKVQILKIVLFNFQNIIKNKKKFDSITNKFR